MSSKFKSNPSAAYKNAVKALCDLLVKEGLDSVVRAYAESSEVEYKKVFAEKRGLSPVTGGHVCVHRLKGAKHCPDRYNQSCEAKCDIRIPNSDHLSEWKHNGETTLIVSQPFGLDFRSMKETIDFCEKHKLEANISTNPSWHFPGSVLTIEYKKVIEPRPPSHSAL